MSWRDFCQTQKPPLLSAVVRHACDVLTQVLRISRLPITYLLCWSYKFPSSKKRIDMCASMMYHLHITYTLHGPFMEKRGADHRGDESEGWNGQDDHGRQSRLRPGSGRVPHAARRSRCPGESWGQLWDRGRAEPVPHPRRRGGSECVRGERASEPRPHLQ